MAGYFSGFDLVQTLNIQIAGSQKCLPVNQLEVTTNQIYDSFQWYKNGIAIPGETSSIYLPTTIREYYLMTVRGPCEYQSNTMVVGPCQIITNRRITYRIKS